MVTRRQQAQIGVDGDDENSEFEGLIRSNNIIRQGNGSSTNGHTSTATTTRPRLPSSDSTEISALNLDHLTNRKVQILSPSSSSSMEPSTKKRSNTKSKFYKTYYGRTMSISEYLFSHLSMLCYYYPYTCGCMVFVILLIIMTLIAYMILNPMQEYGMTGQQQLQQYDHSNIQSMFDVQMGNIDHWCLGGGNTDCTCSDPTIPISRVEYKSWIEAFKSNCKLVKRYDTNKVDGTSSSNTNNVDVAFVGESISMYFAVITFSVVV
jgi:hypothetical protein